MSRRVVNGLATLFSTGHHIGVTDFVFHQCVVVVIAVLAALPTFFSSPCDPSGAWKLNRALSEPSDLDAGTILPSLLPTENLVIQLADTAAIFYDSDGLRLIVPFNRHNTWNGSALRIERGAWRDVQAIYLYSSVERSHRNRFRAYQTTWARERTSHPICL
jgi:hypothetical protein